MSPVAALGAMGAAGSPDLGSAGSQELRDGFRQAMRRVAATVAIVTTRHDGQRFGATATSVTSASMSPPSVLVCLNRDGELCRRVSMTGAFCVNMLAKDQADLARIFSGARSHDARFAESTGWEEGEDLPFLAGAQCSVFCDTAQSMDWGTHTVFIGAVRKVTILPHVDPLLYCDGGFRRLSQPTA